ncbi:CRIB domain-containing protein RIC4-like [Bidens hawaiensis]|uniref:CRIB domain-containing protein RIC4-like n=1 Tax=Bidens hawaiensis TaxID=980011 RepID=UPI00404911D8
MKETRSRFVLLPFYTGCWNDQAVEVKDTKVEAKPEAMEGESSSSSTVKSKKSWSFVAPSRSDISKVMERLIRSTLIKGVTQMFAYKDFEDIESEPELEIGLPTDVKHVTHIVYDGSVTTNPDKNWDRLQPPESLSFPSVSLEQLELQMAKVEKRDP